MTIEECYAAMDGDYEGMLSRMTTKELVERFAVKFLKDTTYDRLEQALKEENYKDAFVAAHTLKGLATNLGFTSLYEKSSVLTEELRGDKKPADEKAFEEVTKAYEKTVAALKEYQGE